MILLNKKPSKQISINEYHYEQDILLNYNNKSSFFNIKLPPSLKSLDNCRHDL